jgi:excisionase family DNA binding protein
MGETLRDGRSDRDETLFPLLTVDEAAARMGMSRPTIYRRMKDGTIKFVPADKGGRRMVPISEIKRYAEELLQSAGVAA